MRHPNVNHCMRAYFSFNSFNSFDSASFSPFRNTSVFMWTSSGVCMPTRNVAGPSSLQKWCIANFPNSTLAFRQMFAASWHRSFSSLDAGCHSGGPPLVKSPMLWPDAQITPIFCSYILSKCLYELSIDNRIGYVYLEKWQIIHERIVNQWVASIC